MNTTTPVKTNPNQEIAKLLNSEVFTVIGQDSLVGFEKAYLIADAAGKLKALLTSEYMRPIMDLQNNRLGFKTDKQDGYHESIVKNCLIEAVLTGVQPFGNQFNIIAGNCYITKEGFGYLLSHFPGLQYEILPSLPRINGESAAIVMKITWTLNGNTQSRDLDVPVKVNKFMGTDAVIGKATRKARAWLYNTINGTEIADGDIGDLDRGVGPDAKSIATEKERERIKDHIAKSKTLVQLCEVKDNLNNDLELMNLYDLKIQELKP